jgi:hypothetical protein
MLAWLGPVKPVSLMTRLEQITKRLTQLESDTIEERDELSKRLDDVENTAQGLMTWRGMWKIR